MNDRSFDMFQNIKANNSQYQVMEANLIRMTYFLSLDLFIYDELTSGWFLHELVLLISHKHGVMI